MAKAIALVRFHVPSLPLGDAARAAFVSGCAFALILAGPVLPF